MAESKTYAYGVAEPGQIAGLSGRQILQAMIDGALPQAPICELLAFWLVEVGDGFAVFEGEPGPGQRNPMGAVHGGWAMALVDSVTGSAGLSTLPPGSSYSTIETKANMVRPITPTTGRVRAEGRIISRGRQILTCEGSVWSTDGKLLAHGTSTLLVLAAT